MKIWMTDAEERAFRGFLVPDASYLEFGCGGSTVATAAAIRGRLVSIDSSPEWLASVREALTRVDPVADVSLRHVDIGSTKEGGYPVDASRRADWPRYHAQVWEDEDARSFDLFMVDGRFRVACFIQTVMRCRDDAVILFHDYASRPGYHVIDRVAREICRVENLSAFVRRPDFIQSKAQDLLQSYARLAG